MIVKRGKQAIIQRKIQQSAFMYTKETNQCHLNISSHTSIQ